MIFTIKQGMNQDILKSYPDNHFDSIVTDPPYGIEFLGKEWDSNTGALETWEECFRVLKPGGHILAFSAARTYHNLATNIESVGFEIRDQLMWIYASGFPKAQDIGKAIDKRMGKKHKSTAYDQEEPITPTRFMKSVACQVCGTKSKNPKGTGFYCGHSQEVDLQTPEAEQWSGWKTALKPAHEPIVMARKPFKGSCLDNVLKHGTGAMNIDATRITLEEGAINPNTAVEYNDYSFGNAGEGNKQNNLPPKFNPDAKGRYPSNVFGEIPDYQKYFYCPKVSRAERHVGFEQKHIPTVKDMVEELGATLSSDGQTVSIPGFSDIKVHGLKHEYEKIIKHKKGSLDHIPTSKDGMLEASYDDATRGQSYMMKKESLGKIQTGLTDKNGNVQTFTSDPATHNLGNNHPTVKPVALMSYLVKLVTPEGGRVLDPFNGSGSTGMACVEHGFDYTGCELDPDYVAIATKRIQGWYANTRPDNNFNELFDNER